MARKTWRGCVLRILTMHRMVTRITPVSLLALVMALGWRHPRLTLHAVHSRTRTTIGLTKCRARSAGSFRLSVPAKRVFVTALLVSLLRPMTLGLSRVSGLRATEDVWHPAVRACTAILLLAFRRLCRSSTSVASERTTTTGPVAVRR